MSNTELSKKLENKNIQCLACAHKCIIKNNKQGICLVRKNINGNLQLLVYGHLAATNIEPIEKKPLYHFYPSKNAFSFGTLGCNFRCDFCQNHELIEINEKIIEKSKSKTVTPQDIIKICLKNEIKIIAYTYNEPAVFFEYAYDTAKLASKHNIKNIFVSNGYLTLEALKKIKPYLNAINIDLKSFNNNFYKNICKARLQPVLDTIKRSIKYNIWTEITTLLIPGKNDSQTEIEQIAKFIFNINPNIPWHISKFFPAYKMQNIPTTSIEKLNQAYNIGKKEGLKYVYIGNMDSKYNNTYCPNCKSLLIKRQGFNTQNYLKQKNKCFKCNTEISGIF
jgi:pyruvate formate lyase activating enzyme